MRALFVVGCNAYEHASQLAGAETDAQRIYDALLRPEVGEYDVDRSRLLLSPTYESLRKTLADVLFQDPSPETFTFFFAGHGSVTAGAFYMWVRDSNPRSLSMSAISLADVFRNISEAAPLQSNFIIDACESGGLIEDLGVLLKPGLLGNAGTPGLTLLATAAQDQVAEEIPAGGVGTMALLDCIEGRNFVQDHKSTLDLVEIGAVLSERLAPKGQNPVVWGLNLYGASGFCKNPRFGSDPASPLRRALQTWPVEGNAVITHNYDALWSTYSAIGGVWDSKAFARVVRAVLQPAADNPEMLASLADRVAVTFLQRAKQARDPFRATEVAAILAVALLSSSGQAPIDQAAQRLLADMSRSLHAAQVALIDDLVFDKFALLSDHGGPLSELHELPLRLAKVLGWAGAATLIFRDDSSKQRSEDQFAELTKLVLEHYSGSLIALSDAQTSGWCIALTTCARLGLREEGEQIAGLLFNSLVQCEGKLARGDLPRDRALEYLLARKESEFSHSRDLVARPIDLMTVLLRSAELFDLENIFDESLWKLDGLAFTAYLPTDYKNFGAPTMEGGTNLVWTIGFDIFKSAELRASWPVEWRTSQQPQMIAELSVLASLLYRDRQPWFLFDSEQARDGRV